MEQVCKQFESFVGDIGMKESSDYLRRAMAVNQHHDAVTGTEKQHVANDYAKRLHIGRTQCQVKNLVKNLLSVFLISHLKITTFSQTLPTLGPSKNVWGPCQSSIDFP